MYRFAPVLLIAALAGPAAAQPVGAVNPQVVTARVENGSLVWNTTQLLPVAKPVAVTVVVNGKQVVEMRTVTELTRVTSERSEAVKNLRATDGLGRVVTTAQLADRLREDAAVVLHVGRLPDAYRRTFRDDVVLIELPGPAPRP
jgi:hypothetical protein